jgi:hypothetical protein
MSIQKTQPTLMTLERLLDEVDEWYHRFHKVRQKLNRTSRGSEAYLDVLPDLEVEPDLLRIKVEHAHEGLEEFEESLTDEE